MPFAQPNWAGGVSPFAVPVYVESTITEPPGSAALVTDVNEDGTAVELRFRIPRGDVGEQGIPGQDAADPVFSASVTSSGPSVTPEVSLTGTYPTLNLGFSLRDGQEGPPGQDAADPVFSASVTSSGPSVTPEVSLTGTYPALNLGFALRDGQEGPPGQDAADPVFSASVTSSGPSVTPEVSLTGTYPNLNIGFSLRDGQDGAPGVPGANGLSSSVFRYQFQIATTPPPSSGHIRPNAATPATTTSLYVAHVDGDENDVSVILANIQPNSLMTLQKRDDDTVYVRFTTSGFTTNVNWTEFFVTEQSHNGLLLNNMQLVLVVQTAGVPGPPGADAADPVFSASVVSSGPSVTPSVSLTGTYPNLDLGFSLRDGSPATEPVFTASLVASGTGVTPAVVLTGTYPNLNLGISLQSGAAGSGSSITINNTTSAVSYRMLFTNATSGTTASALNTHATALTYNPNTLALTNTGGTFACTTVTANLTGTASNAGAVTTVNTVSSGARYLLFSNGVGSGSLVQLTSTLASQLIWDASLVTMTIGNGTTGVGVLTCNTVNAPNLNGTADFATQVTATATSVASERFLAFVPNSGSASIQINNVTATKIACNPSVPSITMGSGVGGSGVITCNSFVGALTGNASSATQVTATSTPTTGLRYLCFTPSASTGVSDIQFSPTLATQIVCQPSVPAITIGNGITGSGTLTVGTVTCTTMNGQASGADQVETVATTSASTRYITFTPSSNASLTNSSIQTATALQYNPGTALLTTTNLTVSGTLTATVGTCTNLAGGLGGSVPYQSSAGNTTFLGISTVAGSIVRSTGTVPTWATPGGFPISFGGNVSAAGMVLQYQLPSALFSTVTLNSALGTPGNGFVTPYSCILVAAAAYSTTASATATATIHVNGSATALTTIGAGTNFSVTGNRVLTLSATTNTISSGSLVEVRVNTAAIGNCQVTLYIA